MQSKAPAPSMSVRVARTTPLQQRPSLPPRQHSVHQRVPTLTPSTASAAPPCSRRSPVCTATTDHTNNPSPTTTASPETSPVTTTTASASSPDTTGSSGAAPPDTTKAPSSTFAKIKAFGIAGTLSYVVTEIAFWAVALPGAYLGYHQSTGQWLSLDTDKAQLVGMAAAFVTGVRFAVPLRMAAAMALVPSMQRLLQKPEDR